MSENRGLELDLAVTDERVAVHCERWLSEGLFVAELCLVGSADALVAADTDADGALDDAVSEEPDQFCSRIETYRDVTDAVLVAGCVLVEPLERVKIGLCCVLRQLSVLEIQL